MTMTRFLRLWLLAGIAFVVVFQPLKGIAAAGQGRFQFTQAVVSTTQDFGVADIVVQRSLGSDGRAAVYISTLADAGNAVAGRDYKAISNVSLVWQDGEDVEKSILLPIYNDGRPQESPKTFSLKLHDAIGATINSDRSLAQVVVVPPSNLVPGTFSFKEATMMVTEGSTLTVPVLWEAGTVSTASVRFDIVCKSACSPEDFVLLSPATQLLEWKRDDFPASVTTRARDIVFKVLDDQVYEPAESFLLRLVPVDAAEDAMVGSGTIGVIGEMLLTIAGPNNARSGTLQFDADCFPDCASITYSMIAGGAALVVIQRRNGSDGDCSVVVATQDGTALAAVDYEPFEETLSWKDGDISDRQLFVKSLDRADPRLPPRRLTLTLQNNKGALINEAHASTTYVDITSQTNVQVGNINFAMREPLEPVKHMPDWSLTKSTLPKSSSRHDPCPNVFAAEPGTLSVAIQRSFTAFPAAARAIVKAVAGTATPGVDYEAFADTAITWGNDDLEVKHVSMKILTLPVYDSRPRSFSLQLSNVSGAIVGDCNVLEVVLLKAAQAPHVVSFDLDMTLGTLSLHMSAPVQSSTLDVTKLLLQSERELKNGPTLTFSARQTTTSSTDGTTIVLNIGAGDLNPLKRFVGLMTSAVSVFLSVDMGLFRYVLNNCQSSGNFACSPDTTVATPKDAALAVSKFTADTIAPILQGYSLDLPRGLLKLHFSEAVDFTSLTIEDLVLSETAMGTDVYRLSSATTHLFSPQPDPLSGALLQDENRLPPDYTFLTLQLSHNEVTALGHFQAGKIGVSRANTFLGIESGFVKDFAGNSATIVGGKLLQVSLADCSPCRTGSYLTSSCSDLKDRKCATCSVCPRNSFALEVCRATQDTVCYPCTDCRAGQFESVPCSLMTDRVCAPCTQCTLDEYEASPCAAGADRICRSCNSCTLTTAQQVLCQRSTMWKRLQMRSPFSCPQPRQQFQTREKMLQRAKSNKCGSGRCSCVATGIRGNSNPNGKGFPDDPRCTGPVAYNILV